MRKSRVGRALPLLALLVLGLALLLVGLRRQPAATPTSVGGCAGTPATVPIVAPASAPHGPETLALDLPGPMLIEPTPCPPGRP